jgi:hypothetical protein
MATWQLHSAWDDLDRSDTGASMRTKKGNPHKKKARRTEKRCLF